jgi:nucleoside-diphosphate-sugar epimerase
VTLMQGTKAYGVHLHPMRIPGRERQPRDEHPNFYWLQEDYIRRKAGDLGCTFTIMRPQMIVGPNIGVSMNLPPIIGVYAAICKEIGRPFGFPGGTPWAWEATDTRLVANAIRWAAEAPAAAGQHFNLTNGEVFTWRDLWPAMAETLGLESADDAPVSMVEFLPAHADVWARITAKHNLRPIAMADLLGESHYFADFAFMYGIPQPPLCFVSTIKIKQAGFAEVQDTEESFVHWLKFLQQKRILPAP